MDISVIIVSYNVRYYLRQCLESVWAATHARRDIEVEVIVVDNQSSDNSVGYLRAAFPPEQYPQLTLIQNRRNVGFGRANNQALRRARGRYILYLNPDTIITEDTLGDCYDFAESRERLGAIGVKMLSARGEFALESRRGLPTPWVAFCKMSGLGSLFPKSHWAGGYYKRYLDPASPAEIEITSGAFMFCSHAALKDVGAFDEKFFMYGEDIDLSYRLILGGYHNWYLPTPIIHYKGESTTKGTYRYVHTFYEAMLIFFQKHFPTASLALSLPVKGAILLQACLALARQMMGRFGRFLKPSTDSVVQRVCYVGTTPPPSLVELADTWGLELTLDSTAADIVAFDAETTPRREILAAIEGTEKNLGMYYPSREKLILAEGICY